MDWDKDNVIGKAKQGIHSLPPCSRQVFSHFKGNRAPSRVRVTRGNNYITVGIFPLSFPQFCMLSNTLYGVGISFWWAGVTYPRYVFSQVLVHSSFCAGDTVQVLLSNRRTPCLSYQHCLQNKLQTWPHNSHCEENNLYPYERQDEGERHGWEVGTVWSAGAGGQAHPAHPAQGSLLNEGDPGSLVGLKAIAGQLMLCYHADFKLIFLLYSTCWGSSRASNTALWHHTLYYAGLLS